MQFAFPLFLSANLDAKPRVKFCPGKFDLRERPENVVREKLRKARIAAFNRREDDRVTCAGTKAVGVSRAVKQPC